MLLLLLLVLLLLGMGPAGAAVVFRGSATGINTGLPTNGTPGVLTITKPVAAKAGMAMIVSIAARPSGMTWTAPAGWTQLSVASEQTRGGVGTAPGGMTMRTYYRIVGVSEATSYTWTFANPANTGGTAVGGMLVFSGIDTATNPINGTPTSVLSPSGTRFTTAPVTTTVGNTMNISVLSVLSADSFTTPTFVTAPACTASGASAISDVIDQRSPPGAVDPVGTTVNMAYFTQAVPGTSCATTATITSGTSTQDTGVAHLMALRPSLRDLSLDMVRSVPLSAGGTASYTMTVTNEGSLPEPGPLAIVNTLPAALSFTGYSGTGWTCSVAGKVVTCTKSGSLAAGASSTPLVINVSVAAGANGVITNTATVSGTGGDGNSENDTATDDYVILPTPYAYFAMDEAANATSFANTAASTTTAAAALGASKAAGNPSPVGQAVPGSPGTCGAVSNPGGAGNAINTNINVNAVGPNAGSIAFWYASSTAWNDGNSRMLFDASADGGAAADRYFFLAKDGTGKLVFSLKDNGTVVSTAISPSYNFAANTWHHIAVSWDMAADRLYVYLDGDIVPVATSTTNVSATLAALNTLYLGAPRGGTITGAAAGYTANGANGYFDEVRVYARALQPLEVASVAVLVHACAGTVDHYELIVPATASACTPLPAVQVYACATPATGTSCSGNLQAAVNGRTVGLTTSAGTLGTGTPAFDAIGQANTTLNHPAGGDATVTLSIGGGANPAPAALRATRCCLGGGACTTSNSCTTTITACAVAANGFNIVDSHYAANSYDGASDHRIYTKLAGRNEVTGTDSTGNSTFRLDIVALKAGDVTETGYPGSGLVKNVKLELFDDSSGPSCNASSSACASCAKPVVATVEPIAFTSTDAGYRNDVAVTIGNANAYRRLLARVTDSGGAAAVVGCSSDVFAVRPSAVLLSTSANAAGTPLATATPAIRAGMPFSLSAATTYGTNYDGTLTLDTGRLTAQDPAQTAAAAGGEVGTLSPSTLTANPATAASGNATYSEVGYLYLAPGAYRDETYTNNELAGDCVVDPGSIANSLSTVKSGGRYGCWVGTQASVSLGRFIPHHFVTTLVPADGTFTYSGQPFASVVVTAVNAAGGTTRNYRSTFARAVSLSDANSSTNNSDSLGSFSVGTSGTASVPAAKFADGVASMSGSVAADAVTYTFNTRLTAPLEVRTGSAPLQLRAVSTGDVVSSSGYETGAITPILSGRIRIGNAYGAAQLPLTLPITAQYYTGTGWVTNTGDSVTRLTAAPTISGSPITTVATCPTSACNAASTLTAGLMDLRLSAANAAGHADVLLNVPAWLHYPWKSATATGPQGRGVFGIYQGRNRIIYRRERY